MTFNETCLYIEGLSDSYDISSAKIDVLLEGMYRNLDIEHKEAELKVIEECGTDEDLHYLIEEADENFIQKSNNAIKKAVENLNKFIKEIIQKVKDFFSNIDNKRKLDKIEKMVDKSPALKNKKVDIPDVEKQNNIFQKLISNTQITLIKMRNLARDPSNKNVEKMNDMYDKDCEDFVNKKNAAKVAVVTVTVVAAIATLKALVKEIESSKEVDVDSLLPENIDHSAADRCIGKESKLNVDVQKAHFANKFGMFKTIFAALKNLIHDPDHTAAGTDMDYSDVIDLMNKNAKDDDDNDDYEEGGMDMYNYNFLDSDAYLESVENEVFGTDDNYDRISSYLESIEDILDTTDTEAYLESVENSIYMQDDVEQYLESVNDELTFDPESYLESVESDLFDTDAYNYNEATDDYLDNLEAQLDYYL